jgi:hypothetical protein
MIICSRQKATVTEIISIPETFISHFIQAQTITDLFITVTAHLSASEANSHGQKLAVLNKY